MGEALLLGFITSGSLMIGAIIAIRFNISSKIIGLIMAFGVGALISSVCFELVEEAFTESQDIVIIVIGLFAGALIYFLGDMFIDKIGGKNRKNMNGTDSNVGLPILLGTVLDGVPESIVIGISTIGGSGISTAMVVAVFLSNIPEALTSSKGLLVSGWRKTSIIGLWLVVIAMSVLSALFGYYVFADVSGLIKAFILSFAGGAILTMLADTMIPEAYRESGKLTGLVVVLGFSMAYLLTVMK